MADPQLLDPPTRASRAPGPEAQARVKRAWTAEDDARRAEEPEPAGRLAGWYLAGRRSLAEACRILEERGATYAVMPAAIGEGQALLLDDCDVDKIRDLLTHVPLGERLAVYCMTDLPGFSFQQHWRRVVDATNMAVLPPHLGQRILAGAVTDEDGIRRIADHHLLSWKIYRALFLSGDPATGHPEHDRLVGPAAAKILKLAEKTGVSFEDGAMLDALYAYLGRTGWQPSLDLLRRLSTWNRFARAKAREQLSAFGHEPPGVTVFYVREQVMRAGLYDTLLAMLTQCGFDILETIDLDEAQSQEAARGSRGGNWGAGAYPVGGGLPVKLLVANDLITMPVPVHLRALYPFLDNYRIIRAKQFARGMVRDRLPPDQWFNPVHSTDQSWEAWHTVRQFAPDEEERLRAMVRKQRADFVTHEEVVRDLSRTGARSKIELIRHGSGLAVKKTYRPGAMRYMEREARFMDEMSPQRREVLPVIERGDNYLIMPFVEARPLRRKLLGIDLPHLMTIGQTRAVADLLGFFFAHGYDPVDLAPHNFLLGRNGEMWVIDFEFMHRWDEPVDPLESACLSGVDDDFPGEVPFQAQWSPRQAWVRKNPYRMRWLAYTGLPLESFLFDPPAAQRAKRALLYPGYLARKVVERSTRAIGNAIRGRLKAHVPVVTRLLRANLVALRQARKAVAR